MKEGKRKKARRSSRRIHGSMRWLIAALLACGMIVAGAIAIPPLLNPGPDVSLDVTFHGQIRNDPEYQESYRAKAMRDALDMKLQRNGLFADTYEVSWIEGVATGSQGESFRLEDQLVMLSFYAEQMDRKKYKALKTRMIASFRSQEGFFETQISLPGETGPNGTHEQTFSTALQLKVVRTLLEGYARFGEQGDLKIAQELSGLLLPRYIKAGNIPPAERSIRIHAPGSVPDFSATPTPKPEITAAATPNSHPSSPDESEPSAAHQTTDVIDLGSVDLYAMQLLSDIDPAWEAIFMRSLELVKGAATEQPLPLFFAAYDPHAKGYIPFVGETPVFLVEDQLRILLSLAEVDQMPLSHYDYLKKLVFDTRSFYQSYHITTGNPASAVESIAGYAYMARIARISGEPAIYRFCADRIFWNTATSVTSMISGLPFTQINETRVRVHTLQTALALKGLY